MTGTQQSTTWADVLALVAQLDASGLADAEVVTEGVSVRVSRRSLSDPFGSTPAPAASSAPSSAPSSASAPAAPVAVTTARAAAPSESVPTGPEISAPVLGVVYLRPAPDQPPFVQVGDTVTPDTTVAIIEVMKLMNPVPAGVHGVVAQISVPDAAMVEYGDVLFRLQG